MRWVGEHLNEYAKKDGLYELTAYYMTASQRTLEITVNGTDRYSFACLSTGARAFARKFILK